MGFGSEDQARQQRPGCQILLEGGRAQDLNSDMIGSSSPMSVQPLRNRLCPMHHESIDQPVTTSVDEILIVEAQSAKLAQIAGRPEIGLQMPSADSPRLVLIITQDHRHFCGNHRSLTKQSSHPNGVRGIDQVGMDSIGALPCHARHPIAISSQTPRRSGAIRVRMAAPRLEYVFDVGRHQIDRLGSVAQRPPETQPEHVPATRYGLQIPVSRSGSARRAITDPGDSIGDRQTPSSGKEMGSQGHRLGTPDLGDPQ